MDHININSYNLTINAKSDTNLININSFFFLHSQFNYLYHKWYWFYKH